METIVLILFVLAAIAFVFAFVDYARWGRLLAGGLFLWVLSVILERVH